MNEIEKVIDAQEKARLNILKSCDAGKAALELTEYAIKNDTGGAKAIAKFLLAIEFEKPFQLSNLLRLDSKNRAKAEVLLAAYKDADHRVSNWIETQYFNGNQMMQKLKTEWQVLDEE